MPIRASDDVVMHDITGVAVSELTAVAPSDLVTQLQAASGIWPLMPFVSILLVVLALIAGPVGLVLLLIGIPGCYWLHQCDRARRSVVAFYDVQDAPAVQYQALIDAVSGLATSKRLWFVPQAGRVGTTHQYKINAGATTLLKHEPASVTLKAPPVLVTNITDPSLTAGRTTLHFLPDRVLLRDRQHYAEITYANLRATASAFRFIETDRPPADATQVGTTWEKVNVGGGPDRRFKTNRQLPVMQYGRLEFTSPHGLALGGTDDLRGRGHVPRRG